jgi:hypothetical protein
MRAKVEGAVVGRHIAASAFDHTFHAFSYNENNRALLYLDQAEYLKAMGIPLQRGRFFTSHDDEHSALVALVAHCGSTVN